MKPPPFVSRLPPLSIRDYELMSPGARQRRERAEELERQEWAERQAAPKFPAWIPPLRPPPPREETPPPAPRLSAGPAHRITRRNR